MNIAVSSGAGPWAASVLLAAIFFSAAPLDSVAQEQVAGASADSTSAAAAAEEPGEDEEIVSLASYNVKADRIEDFGLRIESAPYPDPTRLFTTTTFWFAKFAPLVTSVVPNTAASKAGLQPGERILKSDGQSTVGGLFSTGKFGRWAKNQRKKWAEVSAGKTNVAWTLEVESPTKVVRTVRLVVPAPPPHWGASVWRTPAERRPSVVAETGPLADRSRTVLDNGIATVLPWPFTSVAGDDVSPRAGPYGVGYEWRIEHDHRLHRMVVTQARGRTRIFFETVSPETGRRIYLSSPSGALERAWRWGRAENIALGRAKTRAAAGQVGELPPETARVGFEHELDLWTNKVRKLSPRWPLEVVPGFDPDAVFALLAPKDGARASPAPSQVLAAEFSRLPRATDAQAALFAEAYGKLGADQDRWAYTETSHTIADKRVLVTRVDPSKPEAGRIVLRSVDGAAPTPAEVQEWRDEGGDIPRTLGDIPPLASLVDLKDLRVAQEETGATVFELPIRSGNAEFSADKFQARFRVAQATRAFEEITVSLRNPLRVAGVVKITEAGLHARFRTFDPALAPQPVSLKGGGAARIILLKISRDFETTRTDFQRVEPYEETAGPGL